MPNIEDFVDDEDTHAVAQIKQFQSGRVVGGAQGIDTHSLEDFALPLLRPDVEGAAQGAEVAMVADATEIDTLSVEEKAIVRGEFDGAKIRAACRG